jgi:uncharacterized membrane protein (DUF485 family)
MGWDTKAMLKLMVTSATYRQASALTPELLQRDPDNRLLARGPRHRLSPEMVRDAALHAAGLLTPKIGGPSVKPYQPEGLWQEQAMQDMHYVQSTGPDLYRRSLYTFWKRTSPPPTLSTFDAPDREVCTVRRQRTNTPLQALVLLNDPTYIEAARKLAERLLARSEEDAGARISYAFRLATARAPTEREGAILLDALEKQRGHYRAHPDAAARLLRVGEAPADPKLDPHSEAFLHRLMARQLRLSIACAATFVIALIALPMLNYYAPELMGRRIFGFTLTWFVLGVLFFPFVWIISWRFIKQSIALEQDEVKSVKR